MEELRNLQQIYSLASVRFNEYDGKDFVLPQVFKDQVKEINSNTVTYNNYSAIIETKGNQNGVLKIFLPNQWFYVASYFTDFYNELQRYKQEALKVASKERLKELNGGTLTVEEQSRLNNLPLNETSKSYLLKFITDYSWWSGAKTIDRGDFYVSPILNSARLVNASQSFVADLCAFLADKSYLVQAIISGEENTIQEISDSKNLQPHQQIFYGAPGTGKSNKVEKDTKGKIRFRTTFHPDTDYSSFVGCYKPTMNGNDIEYSFVPQVFLTAYTAAWNNPTEEVYLIIEELNRGNCAQIFGDMFQLLDREKNGYSSYVIRPDQDILRYLEEGTTIDGKEIKAINDVARYISTLKEKYPFDAEKIGKDGKIDCMALPDNLYIIATMNTSDQSLFPMDSAFKRRWDWEYIKINYFHEDLTDTTLELEQSLSWMKVLQELNNFIKNTNQSTTKQLGEWFVMPDDNNHITQQTFINKVLFYLFNDAFKDNDDFRELFGSDFYFEDFYTISEQKQSDLILDFFKKSLNISVNTSSTDNTDTSAMPTQEQNI